MIESTFSPSNSSEGFFCEFCPVINCVKIKLKIKKDIEIVFFIFKTIYSTSTIISISTAMLKGSEAIPTAARACFPRSPKTSTIKSE